MQQGLVQATIRKNNHNQRRRNDKNELKRLKSHFRNAQLISINCLYKYLYLCTYLARVYQ
jgi:hypothetical protein